MTDQRFREQTRRLEACLRKMRESRPEDHIRDFVATYGKIADGTARRGPRARILNMQKSQLRLLIKELRYGVSPSPISSLPNW